MSDVVDSIIRDIHARESLIDPRIDLESYADVDESEHVRCASGFSDDVWKTMQAPPSEKGHLMPWRKTYAAWQLRKGELSVWSGKRGEGKSMILSQVMQALMQQGQTVAVASMEMPVTDTLERIERQALGLEAPTLDYHREYYRWLAGKLYLYTQEDAVPEKRIRGFCRYVINDLKCSHVVIDSLMMVKFSAKNSWEKLEQQADFVRSLAGIAKSTGAHIHLVAHMRKGDGHTRQSADDVKGGGDITDLASCVWMVGANKRKQDEAAKPNQDQAIMAQPDVWLKNEKNRRGITGGAAALWFHAKSLQFIPKNSLSPMLMVRPFLSPSSGNSSPMTTENFCDN